MSDTVWTPKLGEIVEVRRVIFNDRGHDSEFWRRGIVEELPNVFSRYYRVRDRSNAWLYSRTLLDLRPLSVVDQLGELL